MRCVTTSPLRYADGPATEVTEVIRAPIEVVWELVTDIELPARFSAEFLGATWLDDGPRLSARFRGRNQHPAIGQWETTSYVCSYEPPRAFGWHVSDPKHPSSSWWFELAEQPAGVHVSYRARMGPAPSGLSAAIAAMPDKEERIIARRLSEFEQNMRATLQGIKDLAEAAQAEATETADG
jgi:uncharacterized protein YndB with AHSA1/START domain